MDKSNFYFYVLELITIKTSMSTLTEYKLIVSALWASWIQLHP